MSSEQGAAVLSLSHLWVFLLSLMLSSVIVIASRRIPRLSGSARNIRAVQSMHTTMTPRVGGVAIFLGFSLALQFCPSDLAGTITNVFLGASILFIGALLEDLGFGVSPKRRLLLAIVSSLVVIILTGLWLPRVGIPGVDALLVFWFIGVPLTLFVTSGAANALNLVDGVNGLSSIVSITAASAMAAICYEGSFMAMVELTTLVSAAILGFFLLNFPFGKVFLGDAGAYTIGFLLSWFAIAILINIPSVTPWALLLTFFWPVADTCLAIYRRLRKGVSAATADRLHFHQLVLRGLEIRILGRNQRKLANPMTTVLLTPLIVTPALCGVLVWDQPKWAFGCTVVFSVLFFLSYLLLIRVIGKDRR